MGVRVYSVVHVDLLIAMAFYKQYKPPPLKLTKCRGEISTRIIHRAESSSHDKATQEVVSSQARVVQDDVHGEGKQQVMSDIYSLSNLMEPTNHGLERKAAVKGWEKLREEIIKVSTECCNASWTNTVFARSEAVATNIFIP